MVSLLDNSLRKLTFLVWLIGGIGGVLPDTDHIPACLGHPFTTPFWKFNVWLGLTTQPYGRPLHGVLLIAALAIAGYSLTCIGRYIKAGILSGTMTTLQELALETLFFIFMLFGFYVILLAGVCKIIKMVIP